MFDFEKFNFKNDKERTDFLDDFRNPDLGWCLWKKDADRDLFVYRNDLAEDLCFLVEEELITVSWPKKHRSWTVRNRYIVNWPMTGPAYKDGMKTFGDQRASRTQQLAALKEFQKRGSGK